MSIAGRPPAGTDPLPSRARGFGRPRASSGEPTPRRRGPIYVAAIAVVLGGFLAGRGDAAAACSAALAAAFAARRLRDARRGSGLAFAALALLVALAALAGRADTSALAAAAPFAALAASLGGLGVFVFAVGRDERRRREAIAAFRAPLDHLLRTPGFGAGKSERCVEVPWALERVRAARPGARILEVGHARPEPLYLDALLADAGTAPVFALDLARRRVPGFRVVQADLRRAPFRDGAFDVVLCVSTLEHVGRDNRRYGLGPALADPRAAMLAAARELGRLVAPGGRLVLTVPFGIARDHGWFANLSRADLAAIEAASGLAVAAEELFAYADGWRRASHAEVAERDYAGGGAPAAAALACVELGRPLDP
jgi:O-antigen chain-terminating methyltransferase